MTATMPPAYTACGKPYQTTICARPAGHTTQCWACTPMHYPKAK